MRTLDFLIEDKLEEIFSFLPPMSSPNGTNFEPYFSSGPEEDFNAFIVTETAKNFYPLIWLIYPYTEKRDVAYVSAENIRLILAIENSNEMLNKLRLEGSYKKALYPLFYNIRDLLQKANNIEVVRREYSLTKFPNWGETKKNFFVVQKSEAVDIWDVVTIDFSVKINKFCHKLNHNK